MAGHSAGSAGEHRLDEGSPVGDPGQGGAHLEPGCRRARLRRYGQRGQAVLKVVIGEVGVGELSANEGGSLSEERLGSAMVATRSVGQCVTATAPGEFL